MFRKAVLAAAVLLATLSYAPVAATPVGLTVKDGAGTTQVICGQVQSDTSIAECHVLVDTTGAKVDPATKQLQQTLITNLGSPFQAGGSIGNTGFAINGLLPAFASPPTFNMGTLNGAALDATLQLILTKLGAAPAQAGGHVNVDSSALPSGAAADATLQAIKALLGTAPAQVGGKIDTVIQGASSNYSAVIGFASTANAATSASNQLVVNTTSNFTNQAGALSGIPVVGQIVSGAGITAGTTISAVTANSATQYTLTLSTTATVASAAAVTSGGPQLVIPANASRRGWSQQNQLTGNTSASFCYFNGLGTATIGPDSTILPGGPGNFDTKESHVSTGAIYDLCATPATPVMARSW